MEKVFQRLKLFGGNVDIYISNNRTQPLDHTSMTLSDSLTPGIHMIEGVTRWILFISASGSPLIFCFGII